MTCWAVAVEVWGHINPWSALNYPKGWDLWLLQCFVFLVLSWTRFPMSSLCKIFLKERCVGQWQCSCFFPISVSLAGFIHLHWVYRLFCVGGLVIRGQLKLARFPSVPLILVARQKLLFCQFKCFPKCPPDMEVKGTCSDTQIWDLLLSPNATGGETVSNCACRICRSYCKGPKGRTLVLVWENTVFPSMSNSK